MGMDVEDMGTFLAVVREGSFGRAAASLLVSQPAVSERVARLERTVGSPLFERGPRGVRTTPAGELLLPYARRVLDLFDEATRVVRSGTGTQVRMAVHSTFAHRVVPLVLDALGAQPGQVTVRDAHSDEIIAMLLDGVIELGFVLPASRPRQLRFVALPADPVIAVCAPCHPLAGSTVGVGALAGHRVALNRWGAGAAQFVASMESEAVPLSQLTDCSDGHTALALAREHLHVALVTESIARRDLDSGAVAILRIRPALKWTVPLAFAHRAADHHNPIIQAIRNAVDAA
jgi:DNA-binding transcriptional LysR family regulator